MNRFDGSITEDGINESTYKLLFGDEHIKFNKYNSSPKEDMIKLMEAFTLASDEEQEDFLENSISIFRVENFLVCSYKGYKYMFDRMDKHVDRETAKETRTIERYGKCCTASMQFAYNSKRESKVLIGEIDYSSGKVIHAVFEENDLVYDYTKDIVMRKEDYFDLTNFNLLNVVRDCDIKEDYNYLKAFGYIPSKMYLIYRDEVMKDLKKQKKILKIM